MLWRVKRQISIACVILVSSYTVLEEFNMKDNWQC